MFMTSESEKLNRLIGLIAKVNEAMDALTEELKQDTPPSDSLENSDEAYLAGQVIAIYATTTQLAQSAKRVKQLMAQDDDDDDDDDTEIKWL